MEQEAYAQIGHADRIHWWWRARRRIVFSVLDRWQARPPFLNVGSGTGGDSLGLARRGRVVSTDVSSSALIRARELQVPEMVQADAGALPFADRSFSTVLAMDVVEHLDDDRRALAEVARVLEPGGLGIVTVPAYGWLWSAHDERVHHRRRYTRRSLLSALPSGLECRHSSYFNTLLFPAVVGVRMVKNLLGIEGSDLGVPPAPVNRILEALFGLERSAVAGPGLPFGVSLLAVLRRR